MKKMIYGVCCFSLCLFFIIAVGACIDGDGGYAPHPFGRTSFNRSFGRYEFDNAEALQNFNIRVKEWLVERGFVEEEDNNFKRLASKTDKNYDKTGVLFLLDDGPSTKYGPHKWIFICFPDSEDNIQCIDYYIIWQGKPEECDKYSKDFSELEKSFLKEFPPGDYSTAENE